MLCVESIDLIKGLHVSYTCTLYHTYILFSAIEWLKYCWYDEKHQAMNQYSIHYFCVWRNLTIKRNSKLFNIPETLHSHTLSSITCVWAANANSFKWFFTSPADLHERTLRTPVFQLVNLLGSVISGRWKILVLNFSALCYTNYMY